MYYPPANSLDPQGKIAGLGLAARIAAPAATVRTNEAGTVALELAEAVEDGTSPRLVTRGESSDTPPPLQWWGKLSTRCRPRWSRPHRDNSAPERWSSAFRCSHRLAKCDVPL